MRTFTYFQNWLTSITMRSKYTRWKWEWKSCYWNVPSRRNHYLGTKSAIGWQSPALRFFKVMWASQPKFCVPHISPWTRPEQGSGTMTQPSFISGAPQVFPQYPAVLSSVLNCFSVNPTQEYEREREREG
jgi:hypothetical protein